MSTNIADDRFPEINCDPIDLFPLKSGFLAAYPNTLILGYPEIIDQINFTFKKNSYIKIPICSYKEWCDFLIKFGKIIAISKKYYSRSFPIYEYKNYRIICELEKKDTYFLKIINHSENTFSFCFDSIVFEDLCKSFISLYFKPFCLPLYVNQALQMFLHSGSNLELNTWQNILVFVKLHNLAEEKQATYVAEIFLRYKSEIKQLLSLAKIHFNFLS